MILAALPIGTVAGWLTFIAVIAAAFAVWRGAGGTALGTLQTANQVLEGRVHELEELRRADQIEIGKLNAKTDVTLALAPIIEWSTRHEDRAQQRHEAMLRSQDATLAVLQMIADKYGPDPENNT